MLSIRIHNLHYSISTTSTDCVLDNPPSARHMQLCNSLRLSSIFSSSCFLFFFFSSRRRHTRSDRDWSSDVCSSDLGRLQLLHREVGVQRPHDRPERDIAGAEGGLQLLRRAHRQRGGGALEAGRVGQIGRASCRGRGEISGVAVSLKKKKKNNKSNTG